MNANPSPYFISKRLLVGLCVAVLAVGEVRAQSPENVGEAAPPAEPALAQPAEDPGAQPADPKDKPGGQEATPSAASAGLDGGPMPRGAGATALPSNQLSFQGDLFTGRFTYQIPIAVAPARQGADPELALSYSSSAGNGWCGLGWDLGAGYIQRETRKGVPVVWSGSAPLNYYDDAKGFVFNLGGATGALVDDGSGVYRPEIEGAGLRFEYVSDSWVVTDKGGNKFYFGESDGSRMYNPAWGIPSQGSTTFRWMLARVVDVNGNLTTLSYTRLGEMLYLSSVAYNGHSAGLAANHLIEFELEGTERPDTSFSYVSGYRITLSRRLTNIRVKSGGNLVRRYNLTYATSAATRRSLLQSVRVYGHNDTDALPPITFEYYGKTFAFASPQPWLGVDGLDGGNERYTIHAAEGEGLVYVDLFDLDGDGLADRVLRKISDPLSGYAVQRNTGSSFVSPRTWGPLSSQGQTGQDWNSVRCTANNETRMDLVDLDGDFFPDRVMRRVVAPYTVFKVQFNSGLAGSSGFGPEGFWNGVTAESSALEWRSVRSVATPGNQIDGLVELIDLEGDGLPDRVMRELNARTVYKVQVNTPTGFNSTLRNWSPLGTENNQTGEWQGPANTYIDGAADHLTYVLLRDLNGDGLPDRIMSEDPVGDSFTNLIVQFNTGTGFANPEPWGPLDSQGQSAVWKWNVPAMQENGRTLVAGLLDLNGDGLPDRVMRKYESPFNVFKVQLNNGHGFEYPAVDWGNVYQPYGDDRSWNALEHSVNGYLVVGLRDLNGDGLPDRIVQSFESWDRWLVQTNAGPAPDLLFRVHNGLGGRIEVNYRPSTQLDNRDRDWTTDPWDEGAKSLLPVPVYTVSTITMDDGFGNLSTQTYNFRGGVFDPERREFRGFNRAEVTDPLGARKVVYFHQSGGRDESAQGEYADQSSKAKKGIPYRVEYYGSNGLPYSLTLNKVEEAVLYQSGSQWRAFPYISQTLELEYEGLGTYRATAQQFAYDLNTLNLTNLADLGEVSNVNAATHSFADVAGDSLYTHIQFATIANNPDIRNRPAGLKASADAAGNSLLQERKLFYEATRGNLTTKQLWLNPPGSYITVATWQYDQYGNPTNAVDAANIATASLYDATQTFVEQTITGSFTNRSWIDVRAGVPLGGIDAKGLAVTNTYDVFFRPTESSVGAVAWQPATLWMARTAHYLNGIAGGLSGNYVRHQARDDVDTVNGHETYTYADGLGRTTQARVESETNGWFRVTDVLFDARGKVNFATLPYFSAGSTFTLLTGQHLGTWTDYDAVGRSSEVTPSVLATFDANGRYVSSVETGGDTGSPVASATVAYADLERGNPWAIIRTDPAGKRKKYYADARGRVTNIVEVTSAGDYNTCFGYDLLGNLTKATNHLGHVTSMVYDSLGRKTSMTDPDLGTWTYAYDNASRLTQQIDAKNQKLKFYYNDELGRLTAKEIYSAGGGLVATVTFEYDTSNDPAFTVFKGQLFKVTDRQGWQKLGYDVRSRVLKSRRHLNLTGLDYEIQSTYDEIGRVRTLTYPGNVAKLEYTYDTGANLSLVKSLSGTGTQETFWSAPKFNEVGQMTEVSYGSTGAQVKTAFAYYQNSQRLNSVVVGKVGASTNLQSLSYTFDVASNVGSIGDAVYTGDASAALANVTYDDLHRLTSLLRNGVTKSFGYDPIGNLKTNTEFTTSVYNYTGPMPHAVTSVGGTSYTYDACGNMLTRAGDTLAYDQENQLTEYYGNGAEVAFGYAEGGARLWRRNDTSGHLTVWIGDLYEVNNGRVLCHVLAGGKRICTFEPQGGGPWAALPGAEQAVSLARTVSRALEWPFQEGRTPLTILLVSVIGVLSASVLGRRFLGAGASGSLAALGGGRPFRPAWWRRAVSAALIVVLILATTDTRVEAATYYPVFYYYHNDHLGSSSVMTDRSGELVKLYQHGAWGHHRYTSSHGAFAVSHRYTGQVYDADTGLYYYGSRYYDPQLGRFIQPDTIVPSPDDPQTLNRYTYVGNNPLKYVDPTGNELVIAILVGVLVGAGLGAGATAATGGDVGMGTLTGAISGLFGGIGGVFGGFSTALLTGATSGAVNATITGGDVGMGALTGSVAAGVGYGVARVAQRIAAAVGMRPASLGSNLIQGTTSGSAGGTVAAAINGGEIGEGALAGGASGLATSGAKWAYNRYQAGRFLQNSVRGTVTPQARQAILDAGQSPIGQRLMDRYTRSRSVLELNLENNSPGGAGRGPHVLSPSNRMFFDGNIQARLGALLAGEPWGPSMDDPTAFIHELGHTLSGFNLPDYGLNLNVARAENPFRSWAGLPLRNDYALLAQGEASSPVSSRGFCANTFHPWY